MPVAHSVLPGDRPRRRRARRELVCWNEGRVDFAALQRRLHPSDTRAQELAVAIPAAYVVFDILALAGTDVRGVLRRRRWVVAGIAGVFAVLTALQEAGLPVWVNERVLRLVFVFLLGSLAYLYAHRIPMRRALAAGAAAVFLGSIALFDDYRVLGAAPLAYLIVWFGTCFPRPWSMRADLSYGVYIYHWPVFQLLGLTGLAAAPSPLFVPIGLALVVMPAALSWYLIEKPALTRKNSPTPDRIAAAIVRILGRTSRGAVRRP